MKVQVTIEQDYCPCSRYDHVPPCLSDEVVYEADIPDGLIGPISKPEVVVGPGYDVGWETLRPLEKRDMLLEDLWLEAERLVEEKHQTDELLAEMWRQNQMRHA
jgi:hypothetical protein